VHTGDLIGGDG